MNYAFNAFVSGNFTQDVIAEDEIVELQNDRLFDNFRSKTLGENSASHNQDVERSFANGFRSEVDSVVAAVKNRVFDAILTALDNVTKLKVEMAVRSITVSSERGKNIVVQYHDQRDFSKSMKNPPLMTAFTQADSKINHARNDETLNSRSFKDNYFGIDFSNASRKH